MGLWPLSRCEILQGSADALPFSDRQLDFVTAFETVFFWKDIERGFKEVHRVLKDGGLLIAPNFIFRKSGAKKFWQKILALAGIKFAHEWTAEEYLDFLRQNGLKIGKSQIIKGRIDLLYVECAFE